jgi:broad specificity phosphatase PhoE
MLTLVLTRHGLTDRSEPEQHLGQRIDISINTAGRRQAEALARRLAPVRFDRVITSPLFRARETAELVAHGAPVEADPRLREMDYGGWEGRTYAEIEERDAALRRDWELAPDVVACPGGESGDDVARRVQAFLAELLDEHRRWQARAAFRAATGGPAQHPGVTPSHASIRRTIGSATAPRQSATPPRASATAILPERPILAVAHSTTNRILLCVALGIEIREFRRRFVQGQANVTALRWETGAGPGEATLLLLNDLAHLRAANEAPWV